MKALILKDFMVLRQGAKVYGFLILFYMIFFIFFRDQDMSMFQGLTFILCAMLPITALSYDERARWEKYGLTMPVSRTDMVVSKYALGLCLIVPMIFLNLLLIIIMGNIKGYHESIAQLILQTLLMASAGLLFLDINLPLMLKFGVEKGRVIMMIMAVIIILTPIAFSYIGDLTKGSSIIGSESSVDPGPLLLYLIPVVTLILTLISAKISIAIYKKKEFS